MEMTILNPLILIITLWFLRTIHGYRFVNTISKNRWHKYTKTVNLYEKHSMARLNEIVTIVQKLDKIGQTCATGPRGNLALGKAADQSSLWDNCKDYLATKATDGDTRDFDEKTQAFKCAHTQADKNAWWSVDLGDQYVIETVELVNRVKPPIGLEFLKHHYVNNLRDFTISVSRDNVSWQTCAVHVGTLTTPNKHQQIFPCPSNPVGRYVKVEKQGATSLVLCEVFVSGYKWYEFDGAGRSCRS